jgi:hypothetical protein
MQRTVAAVGACDGPGAAGRETPSSAILAVQPAGLAKTSWGAKMGLLSRVAVCGAVSGSMVVGMVGATAPARAANSNGEMGVYQVGLSFNCDKPSSCGADNLGGFWGWWEFDSPANNPNAGYGGDGQAEGCSHSGGFNGAGHAVFDITDWYIAVDPNMGVPTFFASWTETDTFRGQSQTVQYTDASTGIPAFTVHRPILQLFGMPTPPGSSANVQVSWKPAH